MLTKSFLQSRVKKFLHDYMKDELFPSTIQLSFMTSSKTTTPVKKTLSITALVTKSLQDDVARLSIQSSQSKTVDLFLEDLEVLRSFYPTFGVPIKNFQKNVTIIIDGETFKVREESPKQGFEGMIRLICERDVM